MTFSIATFLTVLAILVVILALTHKPLGAYMARVFTSGKHYAPERVFYKLVGVDDRREQNWAAYLRSVLAFSIISVLFIYVLQRLQGLIPGQGSAVDPWVAMNTAISFVTNTNWQSYAPESTVGILVQMLLLAVQNFLSAAVGISVAIALIRGLAPRNTGELGNFWVDLARAGFRILLPLASIGAVVFMSTGVIQNFGGVSVHNAALGLSQQIPGGPVASQEAIKLLGTNGGGYFNANSAHPLENPNSYSNVFSILLILLIPFALPHTYGRLVGSARQGYTILTVMGGLFLISAGLGAAAIAGSPMPVAEGMEQRLGPAASSLFSSATTLTSTGAVDNAHDSLPALGGGMTMLNMMLGEVAPGGVGSGLYGMLVLAIICVFIAGLMVGRTPEFLGKKIGARQMKLAAMYILVTPTLVLAFTGITLLLPAQFSNAAAPVGSPHQFSEFLYAFTSAANSNGSAFGGFTASNPYLATMLGLAMFLGRFVPIILILALAGSLAEQGKVPESAGTLPTHGPLFASLLGLIAVVLTALTYFPALALGPLAEGLSS